jgi:hypothetical protein
MPAELQLSFKGGIEGAGGCGPGILVSGKNQVRRFYIRRF